MHDVRRIEMGHPAQRIEHWAHCNDADDSARTHLASQEPSDHRYGRPQDDVQRTIVSIGDMIIAGQGEGPVGPDPKPLGLIMMAAGVAFLVYYFIGKRTLKAEIEAEERNAKSNL